MFYTHTSAAVQYSTSFDWDVGGVDINAACEVAADELKESFVSSASTALRIDHVAFYRLVVRETENPSGTISRRVGSAGPPFWSKSYGEFGTRDLTNPLPLGAGAFIEEVTANEAGRPSRYILKLGVDETDVTALGSRWQPTTPLINNLGTNWLSGLGAQESGRFTAALWRAAQDPIQVPYPVSITPQELEVVYRPVTSGVLKWVSLYRVPRPPRI